MGAVALCCISYPVLGQRINISCWIDIRLCLDFLQKELKDVLGGLSSILLAGHMVPYGPAELSSLFSYAVGNADIFHWIPVQSQFCSGKYVMHLTSAVFLMLKLDET